MTNQKSIAGTERVYHRSLAGRRSSPSPIHPSLLHFSLLPLSYFCFSVFPFNILLSYSHSSYFFTLAFITHFTLLIFLTPSSSPTLPFISLPLHLSPPPLPPPLPSSPTTFLPHHHPHSSTYLTLTSHPSTGLSDYSYDVEKRPRRTPKPRRATADVLGDRMSTYSIR